MLYPGQAVAYPSAQVFPGTGLELHDRLGIAVVRVLNGVALIGKRIGMAWIGGEQA